MPRTKSFINPKTLFQLCVQACATTLHEGRNLGEARLLPPLLKTRILEVSADKGLVNEAVLTALLHRDTHTLTLGGPVTVVGDGMLTLRGVTVDDGMLRAIATRCQRLTILNLSAILGDKDAVTAAGLLELFPAVGANLRELDLSWCLAVDDTVVAQVARCCPRLGILGLRGCREVSDGSLGALGALEGLVRLNVSGTKVSDLGLVALAEGRSRRTLRKLIVDNCPAVTESGLEALERCTNLDYVYFHGCPVSGRFKHMLRTKPGRIFWFGF